MVETAFTHGAAGGPRCLLAGLLVAVGLAGCATTDGPGGSTVGSPVVVKPLDDPGAVTRALARVQTNLDDVQRRIEELEQRTRASTGDATPPKPK